MKKTLLNKGVIIHTITFYCSPFFLNMPTQFYIIAIIIHTKRRQSERYFAAVHLISLLPIL